MCLLVPSNTGIFIIKLLTALVSCLCMLFNNSGLDGRGLSVCWNPDCRCNLLPKSRRLPFSGFLPFDVSSPAVGDILVVAVGVFAAEARREL